MRTPPPTLFCAVGSLRFPAPAFPEDASEYLEDHFQGGTRGWLEFHGVSVDAVTPAYANILWMDARRRLAECDRPRERDCAVALGRFTEALTNRIAVVDEFMKTAMRLASMGAPSSLMMLAVMQAAPQDTEARPEDATPDARWRPRRSPPCGDGGQGVLI